MRFLKRFFNKAVLRGVREKAVSKRGSALLIVLGFLSFLMVSAVSFSICMRVERQAAANYKHASNARHLLNTALVRAMDEIDAELRIQTDSAGYAGMPKFPTNWLGRVLCSAHADGGQNDNNASVLSWEGMAYLPASLVNDVRRFSRPNPDDENQEGVFDDDTSVDSAGREILAYRGYENYRGAKWRPIRRPVAYLEAEDNESVKPTIGRYAYVCVNVSDMPDINRLLASSESEGAVTNRIFIGSLYNKGSLIDYDEKNRTVSGHFDTMADFYASMWSRDDKVFANGSDGPPFIDWLLGGGSKSRPDEAFGYQNGSSESTKASFFMTDGIVKEEPRRQEEDSNLVDNDGNFRIWNSKVSLKNVDYPAPNLNSTRLFSDFFNALRNAQAADLPAYNKDRMELEFGAMIADYLDDDNFPRSFRSPPMEKVPSISRIYLKNTDGWKVKAEGEQERIGETDRFKRKWKYTLAFEGNDDEILNIDVLYPFYKETGVEQQYGISAAASVESGLDVVVGNGQSLRAIKTIGAGFPDTTNAKHKYARGSSDQSRITAETHTFRPEFDAGSDLTVEFEIEVPGEFAYSDAWSLPEEVRARWVLCTFLHATKGFARQRMDEMFDAAPMFGSQGMLDWVDMVENDSGFPMFEFLPINNGLISFATSQPNGNTQSGGPKYEQQITWQTQAFECPDPRYNWRLKNWIAYANNSDSFKRDQLLGLDGRDGDFYRMSNDCGVNFFNPGELGFFPRFFVGNSSPGGEASDAPVSSWDQCPNANDFFRTLRLYDHGVKPADKIYRYFPVRSQSSDFALDGTRINPLSELPQVLQMAITHIPSSFSWRSRAKDKPAQAKAIQDEMGYLFRLEGAEVEYDRDELSYEGGGIESVLNVSKDDFEKLVNGWFNSMQVAKRVKLNAAGTPQTVLGHNVRETGEGGTILTSLRFNLYDVYGVGSVFKWYSSESGTPRLNRIFDEQLGTEIPECYRKLLFAQSLDNFSDRQQLFLIFLSAETQIQTTGESGNIGTKSFSGGKAVALVWRDPYPVEFKKDDGSYKIEAEMFHGSPEGAGVDLSRRVSPWRQYHRSDSSDNVSSSSGSYKSEFGTSDSHRRDGKVSRSKGFHEMRVLYFRQFTD